VLYAIADRHYTQKEIAKATSLPERSLHYWLEQLMQLGYVARRHALNGGVSTDARCVTRSKIRCYDLAQLHALGAAATASRLPVHSRVMSPGGNRKSNVQGSGGATSEVCLAKNIA